MTNDKGTLRAGIRAARRARVAALNNETGADLTGADLTAAEADHFASAVLDLAGGGRIAAYLSMPSEPPTSQLLARAGAVLVPRATSTPEGEPTLAWVEFTAGDPVARAPLGMDEPLGAAAGTGAEPLRGCAVVVVPSLAVDRTRRRLGQGGGYYDRVLAELASLPDPRPVIATLLYDDEVLDDVAAEPHDACIDVVITPTRVLK